MFQARRVEAFIDRLLTHKNQTEKRENQTNTQVFDVQRKQSSASNASNGMVERVTQTVEKPTCDRILNVLGEKLLARA